MKKIILLSTIVLFAACMNNGKGDKQATGKIADSLQVQTFWFPYTDANYGFTFLLPRTDTIKEGVKNASIEALAWLKPSCGDADNCPLITSLDEHGFFLFIHPGTCLKTEKDPMAFVQKIYDADQSSKKTMSNLHKGKFFDGTPFIAFDTKVVWDSLNTEHYNDPSFVNTGEVLKDIPAVKTVTVAYFIHGQYLFRYFYDQHNADAANIVGTFRLLEGK